MRRRKLLKRPFKSFNILFCCLWITTHKKQIKTQKKERGNCGGIGQAMKLLEVSTDYAPERFDFQGFFEFSFMKSFFIFFFSLWRILQCLANGAKSIFAHGPHLFSRSYPWFPESRKFLLSVA